MGDAGQQVKQSALVGHKFQRLCLRAFTFLNSNNEDIVLTPSFVLHTLRRAVLF